MIIVWKGQSPQISLQIGNSFLAFKRNVPAFVSRYNAPELTNGQFEEWDGQIEAGAQSAVFVALSWDLTLFLSSLLALEKIAKTHPLSEIHVQCNPDHVGLIDIDRCKIVASREKSDYYREFILTHEANPILSDKLSRLSSPLQLTVLNVARIAEIDQDDFNVGYKIKHAESGKEEGTAILNAPYGPYVSLAGLATELSKGLSGSTILELAQDHKDTRFSLVYNLVLSSKNIICIGDSPYAFLAAAIGKQVRIIHSSNYSLDLGRQYRCYTNAATLPVSAGTNLDQIKKSVTDSLKKDFNEPRKWERQGLDDSELVTTKPESEWESDVNSGKVKPRRGR